MSREEAWRAREPEALEARRVELRHAARRRKRDRLWGVR